MPTTRPGLADGARELAREVARPAGDVEHAVAAARAPSSSLAIRCSSAIPGPNSPFGHPAERRAPPALVDAADDAGAHQVLDGAGRLEIAAEQVEVAGVASSARPAPRLQERQHPLVRAVRPWPRRLSRSLRSGSRRRLGSGSSSLLHRARGLALACDPLEPRDRALALDAGRVVRVEVRDQALRPGPGSEARSEGWRRRSAPGCPRRSRRGPGSRRSGRSAPLMLRSSLLARERSRSARRSPSGPRR